MARVLVYTSPARGHLYPVVPIVSELVARGHEVALRTLSSQIQTMRDLDIDAEPISEDVEHVELDDYKARSIPAMGMRALATFAARATPEAPDLAQGIAAHDPDALLIDINCWGAATVAEASGLPWAMYSPFLLMLPSRNAPPFGPGLRPLGGPLGRVRDTIAQRVGSRAIDRAVMPSINRLRAAHSLPALSHFDELVTAPPLLLALTAEGFEYPRGDWPANVRMVGPMSWSPPAPAPAWLAEMSDPLVLVTCSTERQRDKRLLHVALESLPAAGISVIGTTAAHDPAQFIVPAGSKVERFIPHEAILERAACVVCHGGMGITQKALAAEIPVVVVPFGRDQLETARRVEFAGAGVRVAPRRLTPGRLADAVATAIECREGAQRVGRAFAAAGGAAAATDAIEGIAGVAAGGSDRAGRALRQP
jgi:MGT family glycosyltransferase